MREHFNSTWFWNRYQFRADVTHGKACEPMLRAISEAEIELRMQTAGELFNSHYLFKFLKEWIVQK